jgi:ankyrin repeat protein
MGNNPKLLYQIRLDNQCLNDDSFLYIACNGHSSEFIRLFQRKVCMNISTVAKDQAFVSIIENGLSPEMICELLKDDFVNAAVSVLYEDDGNEYKATALHWSCMFGYPDVVKLLLKYDNVDVCFKDINHDAPIHYAAQFGHAESYSF